VWTLATGERGRTLTHHGARNLALYAGVDKANADSFGSYVDLEAGFGAGGLSSFRLRPRSVLAKIEHSCFTAGTPLLTADGPRAIETLREGDWVLSRDEHDSAGPIVPRRIVQTFVRTAMVQPDQPHQHSVPCSIYRRG
jgi:hypothetical protein